MPIRKFLFKNKNKILIEKETEYKQVKVRLYGKGVELRGKLKGHQIKTTNQFLVTAGQFIMSKIDARNGAFGIIPQELEGAIVTQDFLTYEVNSNLILADFFILITTTKEFYSLCQRASSGTTNRQRIDEKAFLGFEIPVPSIEVQQNFLDEYSAAVDLATKDNLEAANLESSIETILLNRLGLKPSIEKQKKVAIQLIRFKDVIYWGTDKIFNSIAVNSSLYKTVSLEEHPELYQEALRGKSPKYDNRSSTVILNQKCNRWNSISVEFAKRVSEKWYNSLDKDLFTKEGDILINSTGEGTIGRASYITVDFAGLMYDSHMLLLRLSSSLLDAEYLVEIINSKYGQSQIENLKSAKSTKQTELGINNLLKIRFPYPDISIQLTITKDIKALRNKIKRLREKAEAGKLKAQQQFESIIFNK